MKPSYRAEKRHKLLTSQHQEIEERTKKMFTLVTRKKIKENLFLGITKRIWREQERKCPETSLKEMSHWGENSIIGRWESLFKLGLKRQQMLLLNADGFFEFRSMPFKEWLWVFQAKIWSADLIASGWTWSTPLCTDLMSRSSRLCTDYIAKVSTKTST